jgi:hypothetical protein
MIGGKGWYAAPYVPWLLIWMANWRLFIISTAECEAAQLEK